MLSSFKPCLNACSATTSLFINASNFVQRYSSRLYLRKLSLHSVVSRILQKRRGHPGDGCRPRHSRRPNARRESICTGSCDARILTCAQMFVQAKPNIFSLLQAQATRAPPARAGSPPSASYSRLNTTQTIVQLHLFACLSFGFGIECPWRLHRRFATAYTAPS